MCARTPPWPPDLLGSVATAGDERMWEFGGPGNAGATGAPALCCLELLKRQSLTEDIGLRRKLEPATDGLDWLYTAGM